MRQLMTLFIAVPPLRRSIAPPTSTGSRADERHPLRQAGSGAVRPLRPTDLPFGVILRPTDLRVLSVLCGGRFSFEPSSPPT